MANVRFKSAAQRILCAPFFPAGLFDEDKSLFLRGGGAKFVMQRLFGIFIDYSRKLVGLSSLMVGICFPLKTRGGLLKHSRFSTNHRVKNKTLNSEKSANSK